MDYSPYQHVAEPKAVQNQSGRRTRRKTRGGVVGATHASPLQPHKAAFEDGGEMAGFQQPL